MSKPTWRIPEGIRHVGFFCPRGRWAVGITAEKSAGYAHVNKARQIAQAANALPKRGTSERELSFQKRDLPMKCLFTGLTVTTLAVLAGCNQETPGAPEVTKVTAQKPAVQPVDKTLKSDVPMVPRADDTFLLEDVPRMATQLKQGQTKELTISIARGQNFDEDVTLKFAGLPKGVTFDPASPVIKHWDKGAKLTLKVADDVSPGDFMVKVKGHPTKGADATNEFKFTVAKK